MTSVNSYLNSIYQPQTIVVNGITMTLAQFKAMKRAKERKAKKQQRMNTLALLPKEIKEMMKNVKVLKSLEAYKKNGYRQWGTICNQVLAIKGIKEPFKNVVSKIRSSKNHVNRINELCKKNDTDVFEYVAKLQWCMEDLSEQLDLLVKGINASGVNNSTLKTHECINGIGRRLGLRILAQRSSSAVSNLSAICYRLGEIERQGLDALEYCAVNGKQIK